MKHLLVLLLFALFRVSASFAATITLGGRIEGRLPGSAVDVVNYHTLDFYWVRVPEPTQINIEWCVTNGPGGSWNTSVDLHIYSPADAHADLTGIGTFSVVGDFCATRIYFLQAGNYIFAVNPGDTGYDGEDGLVPYSESGKDFLHYDYAATITGNLELYESWIGQTDRTFLVAQIPEPGAFLLCGLAGFSF